MMENVCVVKILLLILLALNLTNGFNLSPKPNLSLREPNLKIFKKKSQSSYFGFTINLRRSSVFVGAPRAQSTLESQRKINENGAIYKCTFATDSCAPFIFDNTGNIESEYNNVTLDSENKNNQWLGASMDGGSEDTDILVVCAPRLTAVVDEQIFMHGICYWISNTREKSANIKKITPLRLISKQFEVQGNLTQHVYAYGEQGLSVHVTTNNQEIIIGAPGINIWKGSVIRYQTKMSQKLPEINNTVISDPDLWNYENIAYFGYSVGSGYFDSEHPNKVYYVASAPQAEYGKVYIFDINVDPSWENHSIKKFYTFDGSQFGEYFGYSVLAEDLNGDTLTDLIISAPLYSSNGHVEQGAIYVFINKGRFFFELQKIIKSPVEGMGRFGTSISRLGDINLDGFNDIAVGAPFAGNGTVFIYLGSSKGLREVHSQQLSAVPTTTSWGQQMFGHGLSKGCDIDRNGFNDFAIGAPNAEAVFVYYAYPVVKILATIKSMSREIKREQKTFQIEICYSISTKSQEIRSQNIAIQVNVDPNIKRVTLVQTKSNKLTFNAEATKKKQCRLLDANVKFIMAEIYKAIELEIHYSLIDGIPFSEKFCKKCAVVDPTDPKSSVDKIIFTTGCKTDICIADLKVKSYGVSPTYILGTNNTLSVTYEVTNSGEAAHLPQISITSSNKMPFNKKPPFCDQRADFLLCDLNQRQSMLKNDKENITIEYDVSQIEGLSINITAYVFCTGKEYNSSDNFVSDFITLEEFTEIEVNSNTNTTNIDLKNAPNSTEIIKIYELKSRGPSKIRELEITIEIPIAHKFYGSTQLVPVIDVKNITIECVHNNQMLLADKTLVLSNPTEARTENIITKKGNQTTDQTPTINSVELEKYPEVIYKAGAHERSRNTKQTALNTQHIKETQKKLQQLHQKELLGLVRINRTIVFSCIDPEMTTCAKAVIKVDNFIPDTPLNISLKYSVDLNAVNKTLTEPWEFFVIITKLDIIKVGDLNRNTTNIKGNLEFMDVKILKHQLFNANTPSWVIILSIFGGLLILSAISYGMQKGGFFKRKTIEQMEKILQEKQCVEDWKNEMEEHAENQEEDENDSKIEGD